jgi:hypothetical protein
MRCKIVLLGVLSLYAILAIASVPSTLTLNGIVYHKAQENVMGNDKTSQYIPQGETLSNWSSKVTLHFFMFEKDPQKLAQQQFGGNALIEPINGDQNNILQTFDTMNSVGKTGDPIIFQQNLWRYQKLSFDKGIMAVEYSQTKMIANQAAPEATQAIPQSVQEGIKNLPIESYSF